MPPRVVVVGSANLDQVARLAAIPAPGETVLASERERRAGGKGLNQAVAAARAGVRTALVAAVGADREADLLMAAALDAGVETELVRRVAESTGTAWVMVRPDGENAIVVDPGANAELRWLTEYEAAAVGSAAAVLVQLEVPLTVVAQTVGVAAAAGVLTVVNAAPAQQLTGEVLADIDVLVVNEHEAAALGDALDAAASVVVTQGARGAWARDRDGVEHRIPGLAATVVDTTGAGDTFAGYLAAELAAGSTLPDAVRVAVAAGAVAVERAGAVDGIPDRATVDARLGHRRLG